MTSYLRSWWTPSTPLAQVETNTTTPPPTILRISPPPDDEDGEGTEREDNDDDSPPAFPSLSSAQRLKSTSPSLAAPSAIPSILTDAQRMPPPPLPHLAARRPGVNFASSSSSSRSSSLAVPPTTTKAPQKPKNKRDKVELAPGHSPLDWADLKASGVDMRVRVSALLHRTPPRLTRISSGR